MGFFDFFRSKKNNYENKTNQVSLSDINTTDKGPDDGSFEFSIGLSYETDLDKNDINILKEFFGIKA